jgi:spore maturation protein CgeB
VERLFLQPARRLPHRRFVLAGSEDPAGSSWPANVFHKHHVPPERHPAVYCSSRLTLNVIRRSMAHIGYCPSRGLFEAAACGAAILSNGWVGLERFFEPGREILVASSTDDAVAALERSDAELRRMAARGRRRALAEHTSEHRAIELECILEARNPEPLMRRVRIGAAGLG